MEPQNVQQPAQAQQDAGSNPTSSSLTDATGGLSIGAPRNTNPIADARVFRSFRDLPSRVHHICDDLIKHFNDAMTLRCPLDVRSETDTSSSESDSSGTSLFDENFSICVDRTGLWTQVFNNWDTTRDLIHPGFPPEHFSIDSMVEVGVYQYHAGPPAPVYLQLDFNTPEDMWGTYTFCDLLGNTVPVRAVKFKANWNMKRALVSAALRWDQDEINRAARFNTELLVCWARCRLVHWMRTAPAEAGDCSTKQAWGWEEELSELVQASVPCLKKILFMTNEMKAARLTYSRLKISYGLNCFEDMA
ncbi:hypothetical protein QBC47DRAFT_415838 [Echria macrotheca]|uniref:Uncharacterized protein n=1 Tax=Echria macrotheca TaxID=438768 RepID=A0AAJ0F784_9PEZI|nr:hypothetical protein QBC47DRAFT_415838 [Echria macrotheca]